MKESWKNLKLNKKMTLFLMSGLILSACQTATPTSQSTTEMDTTTQQTTQAATENKDIRFIPELSQIESALQANEKITLGNEIYRTTHEFVQHQDAFDIAVNQMVMYEVTTKEKTYGLSDNLSKPSAVVILNVRITNKTKQAFYFPIQELRLDYQDAPISLTANHELYPLDNGNLADILLAENSQQTIASENTVEGYLVYSLSPDDLTKVNEQAAFMLNVSPPQVSSDEIVGLTSSTLGYELPIFLPVTKEQEDALIAKSTQVQDRLTVENWGNKTILADQSLSLKEEQDNVSIILKRLEISDFVAHDAYQSSFEYFPNGQVIVSAQFEISNQSATALLPVDSIVNLTINGDVIHDDYILINEEYGQQLLPSETTTIIKSFALDKQTFQQRWQDLDIQLDMQLSSDTESVENVVTTTTVDSETTEAVSEWIDEVTTEIAPLQIFATFVVTPEMTHFVSQSLSIVDSRELIDETTVEEQTFEETTTEIEVE